MLAFEEIRTIITALGTGIGTDFDVSKLRYHKVIIMTDADIDGSHIRTLLLTFFFRQMHELVSRGHLYIAQPPLYKIKKGKQEQYIKGEAEFNELIVNSGTSDIAIVSADGVETKGNDLKFQIQSLQKIHTVKDTYRKLLRDFRVLYAAAQLLENESLNFEDQASVSKFSKLLEEKLKPELDEALAIELEESEDPAERTIIVSSRIDGVLFKTILAEKLLHQPSFKKLRATLEHARKLGKAPYSFKSSGDQAELAKDVDLLDLANFVDAKGRKGLSIMRYKGLGEMNPDQLWETTLDPCLLYTSPSPRDKRQSRMPSSA